MDDTDGFTPDPFAPFSYQEVHGANGSVPAKPADEIWEPILPAPEEPPEANRIRHHRHGTAVARWVYRDEAGRPLFATIRFDTTKPDGTARKEMLPYTYGHRRGTSRSGGDAGVWRDSTDWCWKRPSAPLPIYGLDRLTARPSAPVLVCEGEKAADAAAWLFRTRLRSPRKGEAKRLATRTGHP